MSKDWKERPSSLLGIDDPYSAYCIDEVVHLFGRRCELAMDEAEVSVRPANAKARMEAAKVQAARTAALNRMLQGGEDLREPDAPVPPPTGKFRDPATMMKARKEVTASATA